MPFDPSTAKPVEDAAQPEFDLSTAVPVAGSSPVPAASWLDLAKQLGGVGWSLAKTLQPINTAVGPAVAENALAMGTGMLTAPVNEAVKAYQAANEKPETDLLSSYQPRGDAAKLLQTGISTAMAPVSKAWEWAAQTNNPDPAVRATGHILNAVASAIPLVKTGASLLRSPESIAPERADIKAQADANYAAVRDNQTIIPQDKLGDLYNEIAGKLAKRAYRPGQQPAIRDALSELENDATRPDVQGSTISGLDSIRQVFNNVRAEHRGKPSSVMATDAINSIDDFITNEANVPELPAAREAWQRYKKSTIIQGALDRAANATDNYTQSGSGNALRIAFKNLLNSKQINQFSETEQQAIRDVARSTTTQRAITLASKLAPRGVVSAIASSTIGNTLGGPLGAAATMGIGEGAMRASDAMRLARAMRASEMVRLGSAPPPTPLLQVPSAAATEGLVAPLVIQSRPPQRWPWLQSLTNQEAAVP